MDTKDLAFHQRVSRMCDIVEALRKITVDLLDEYEHMRIAAERFAKRRNERQTTKAAD